MSRQFSRRQAQAEARRQRTLNLQCNENYPFPEHLKIPSSTSTRQDPGSTLARPGPYPGKTRQDQARPGKYPSKTQQAPRQDPVRPGKARQVPRHPPTHNSDVDAKSNTKPIPSPRVTMAPKSPEKVFPEFNTVCLRKAMAEIPETYLELVLLKESLDSINRHLRVGLNSKGILDALRNQFIEFRQTSWRDSMLHIEDDALEGELGTDERK